MRDDFGDMFAKGIIDPVKVTRSAIENAASIASLVLTTESLVTDIPEPPSAPAMPPPRVLTSQSDQKVKKIPSQIWEGIFFLWMSAPG